jgi:F420-non-reducing hydrogenase small subunit
MAATVICETLCSCAGCEISLLNLGETVLELTKHLDILHCPILMDHKYAGDPGQSGHIDLPRARIGIVSGAVRTEENLEVLLEVRSKVDMLISLGTCAVTGGLPAMDNLCQPKDMTDFIFGPGPTSQCLEKPAPASGAIPALLPKCASLADHVTVDMVLPGCPPHPDWIAETLSAVLEGRRPVLPGRSVCSVCPAACADTPRAAKAPMRFLKAPASVPEAASSSTSCFLAQGFVCLGPVTRAGCGGRQGPPLCIAGQAPCRGCYGPARPDAVPPLDFLEALAVSGYDPTDMPDKPGYLSRFTGAFKPPSDEEPS